MPRAAFPSGRKFLLLVALAAIIIGGALWWQRPPPEPVYQGRRLSELVFGTGEGANDAGLRVQQMRACGPAAVTWLAYTVEHGKHPFRGNRLLSFDKAPAWLRRYLPERWDGSLVPPPRDERRLAVDALQVFGPAAAPAIPALVGILKLEGDHDEQLFFHATLALQDIGPASWPAVSETLEHGNLMARIVLAQTMPRRILSREEPVSENETTRVAQALIKALHDSEPGVRQTVAHSIAECHRGRKNDSFLDPAIPELIRVLSDREPYGAILALAEFGTKAAPATSRMIELLDNPFFQVRQYAAFALGRIDLDEKRSAALLRTMLHRPEAQCRKAAASALKELGISTDEESANGEDSPAR